MFITALGRGIAVAVSVGTFAFLFINDSWRRDNLFLVPDLILCGALLVAAFVPRRWAPRVLLPCLGFAAGVLATSVSAYAVTGRIGAASLLGAVACVGAAALLLVRPGDEK